MSEHASEQPAVIRRSLVTRWLGAGLATVLSVTTLVLAVTGRLTLFIAPETVWFACAAAVITIVGAVWSCTIRLGAEEDHGHDHGHDESDAAPARRALTTAGAAIAGVTASVVVVAALVLPPASLSVELAMSRDLGNGTLFAGADDVVLGQADTSAFGVGDWATVFATSTRPERYDGEQVTLTGFVTPSGDNADEVRLTRMVITHCVIDAQPAAVPVSIALGAEGIEVGDWIEVAGVIRVSDAGTLQVVPDTVAAVDEPGDPYEY